jgi:hypothetical protein
MSDENPYRLRYSGSMHLIARDRPAKMMYLGGLGGMGLGEMWFINSGDHRFENWETAPERQCPDAERKCLADCPEPRPEWAAASSSWPRCWLLAGHEGQHSVGYDIEVRW